MYSEAGEYKMAMELLKKSSRIVEETHTAGWGEDQMIGNLYVKMGNADSALYFLTKNYKQEDIERISALSIMVGEAYFLKKDYKQANHFFLIATDKLRKAPLNWWISRGLIGLAKTYSATSNFDDALKVAREGLLYANSNNARLARKDGYELVSDLFYRTGLYDGAYSYLKKFMLLRDSILSQQFLWKLNSYKNQAEKTRKDGEIGLLNKNNQLKEQKLKQQATLRNSLIIGILLLLLLGVFIFRNLLLKRKNDKIRMQKDFELQQLESEKKQAELHQRAVELEMQALRAQMNPHFIFNCLSSINRFIFKNDNKAASDYLTRFSRLIRMVLMNSSRKMITLEDELEMLRLYLDLERLRFKDAFDYSITTTNIVDAGNIFIPPLLLQPFCENAVWHGLMHKDSKGHLNIIISEVINEIDKALHCVIEDDGVGRQRAAELKSKSAENEKSMGLKITTERLALLNQENIFSTFYKIDDIMNEEQKVAGTRVQLKIKYKESIEEYV